MDAGTRPGDASARADATASPDAAGGADAAASTADMAGSGDATASGDAGTTASDASSSSRQWAAPVLLETAGGHGRDPQVAMSPSGDAVAVWYQSVGATFNVYGALYDASTGSWSRRALLETHDAGHAKDPRVAIAPNGDAVVVWQQDDGKRINVHANRYDAKARAWGKAVLLETGAGEATTPDVAVDGAGNAVAVWLQVHNGKKSVWANRFDAAASKWGTATLLESIDAGDASSPRVAMARLGGTMAVWSQYDGKGFNVYAARFDPSGASWNGAKAINAGNDAALKPDLTADRDGNVVAVWLQNAGAHLSVYASRYDAKAASWSAPTLIERNDAAAIYHVSVAGDASGNAVATWQHRDDVWASRYDALAGAWRAATKLETLSGRVFTPRAAVAANGDAFVTWYQLHGSHLDAYVSRYDGATCAWASPAHIESHQTSSSDTQIAADDNGNALVVWTVWDGARDNVWGTRYR